MKYQRNISHLFFFISNYKSSVWPNGCLTAISFGLYYINVHVCLKPTDSSPYHSDANCCCWQTLWQWGLVWVLCGSRCSPFLVGLGSLGTGSSVIWNIQKGRGTQIPGTPSFWADPPLVLRQNSSQVVTQVWKSKNNVYINLCSPTMYVPGSNWSFGLDWVGINQVSAALFSQYWSCMKPRIWA